MDYRREIYDAVIEGDAQRVEQLTREAVEHCCAPEELLSESLIAAMADVGDRFEKREFFVPEMLVAARAMKAGVNVLRPLLVASGAKPAGTVVIGTVSGDLHDIGKNLVVMMLEGAGFRVIDLGVDIPPEGFVQAIRENSPDIVGMSALLTTTMLSMKSTVAAIQSAGLRDKVYLMVGGAPLSQQFADEIGADAYGADASSAARIAKHAVSAT